MENSKWTQVLLPLLTLALQLEREGQYSLAKLTRSAVDALGRRAAYQSPPPVGKDGLIKALYHVIDELTTVEINEQLIEAFRRGTAALESGRLALIGDTPHPYVCRTCGYVVLGDVSKNCPTCGAWPETFQWFPPIYWLDALDPFGAVEKLKQTPLLVSALLGELPEEALIRQPPDGGWNIKNILTHLRDSQEVLIHRLDLFQEQSHPVLASKAIFEWADQENERPQSGHEIFEVYREVRSRLIAKLERIPLSDWWRTGMHEEFGEVSIKQQVSYFATHEFTHLPQLQRLCN